MKRLFSLIACIALVFMSCIPVHADTLSVMVGEFENEYDLDSATAYITASKTLTGRDLEAGEFSFILRDEDGTKVETVTNDSDGDIVFTGIEITAAGTYTYTIEEVEGSLGGVTYDDTVFTVTITATENEDDECIDLEIEYSDDPVFENIYDDGSVNVTLTATKVLNGATLEANNFAFQLMDEDYNVLATATNKADGTITLGTLSIGSEGVYTYYVSEIVGSSSNIQYDTNVYPIVVTVSDDGEGTLTASVSSVPTFTNTYVSSKTSTTDDDDESATVDTAEDEDADDYRTGDTIQAGIFTGLLIAIIGIIFLIWIKKSQI